MNKNRITIGSITAGVALLVLGLLLFQGRSEEQLPPGPGNSEIAGLGFTYLPVTPQVSDYYHLGVNSGALVTSVTPMSPADKAGVKIGDVILSFDGTPVEEAAPLLGMVLSCPAGHNIMLELWRGENIDEVELIHAEK